MATKPKPFRRFTNVGAVIHLLKTRSITLLNPATWDDRNDAYFMAEYKRYKRAKTVLAVCFAECQETYHHWRVYAHGPDGACVLFDKQKVLGAFGADEAHIVKDYVRYKSVKEAAKMAHVNVGALPFLKRTPFKHEQEYRVVFTDTAVEAEYRSYPIDLGCVEKIALSPWMPKSVAATVREVLHSIDGCSHIRIVPSALLNSETWKALTTRVTS